MILKISKKLPFSDQISLWGTIRGQSGPLKCSLRMTQKIKILVGLNIENFYLGSGAEEMVLKDMRNESGEDLPFGDRRQELVFIGIKLSIDAIQNTLDSVSNIVLFVLT